LETTVETIDRRQFLGVAAAGMAAVALAGCSDTTADDTTETITVSDATDVEAASDAAGFLLDTPVEGVMSYGNSSANQ
jgi:ABC-type glycerol-3-phosphate transport system substrate-binding protein